MKFRFIIYVLLGLMLIAVTLNTLLFNALSHLIGITSGITLIIFFAVSYFKSISKKSWIIHFIIAILLLGTSYVANQNFKLYSIAKKLSKVKYYNGPIPSMKGDSSTYIQLDLKKYSEKLHAYNSQVTIEIVAEIKYKGESFIVNQIDYVAHPVQKKMLIFTGVHGDEIAGTLSILKLLDDIKLNPSDYANWQIRILTPINPVGISQRSRYNEDGCDINRDFKDFTTIGAKLQKEAIDNFLPHLVISLHEKYGGYAIYANKAVDLAICEAIIEEQTRNKIPLSNSFFNNLVKFPSPGIFKETDRIRKIKKWSNWNSLETYADKIQLPVLTSESDNTSNNKEMRIESHFIAIKTVIQSYK